MDQETREELIISITALYNTLPGIADNLNLAQRKEFMFAMVKSRMLENNKQIEYEDIVNIFELVNDKMVNVVNSKNISESVTKVMDELGTGK